MKLFSQFERNLRVAILVLFVAIIATVSSIFCFFNGYVHIPLGFLLAGVVNSLLYLFSHFMVNLDIKNGTVKYSIISVMVRNIVLLGLMLIIAFMYYRWDIKLFNIFVYVGIYTVGILLFLSDHLIFKNQ